MADNALTLEAQAVRQAYSGLPADQQAAIYGVVKTTGGGAQAFSNDRYVAAGIGAIAGAALLFALTKIAGR